MDNNDVTKIKEALKKGKLTIAELADARRSMNAGKLVQFDLIDANEIVLFANHNQSVCWQEEIQIAASSFFKKVLP